MAVSVTEPQVEAALHGMRAMLEADGYGIAVQVGDKVGVEVLANPSACADCLVPRKVLSGVVVSMLAQGGVVVDEADIELTYPADH